MATIEEKLLYPNRELYIRITMLDKGDVQVGNTIEGYVKDGSVSLDGNSPVRRNLQVSFVLDRSSSEIQSFLNLLTMEKRFKAEIGVRAVGLDPAISYFNLGIFIMTEKSYSKSIDDKTISITAQDKMSLLNGDISGVFGVETTFVDLSNSQSTTYYDIINNSLTNIAEMPSSKINIFDLPIYAERLYRTTGNLSVYTNSVSTNGIRSFNIATGNPYTSGTTTTIGSGQILSAAVPFAPRGQFIAAATDTISSVVEKVAQDIEGDYEYFFDTDGNFTFRLKPQSAMEKPLSTSAQDAFFTDLFSNGKNYLQQFYNINSSFSFDNKNIITSFQNNPTIRGIRNDFYIHGKNNLLYHLIIGDRPDLTNKNLFSKYKREKIAGIWKWKSVQNGSGTYSQDWRQYIIDICDIYTETESLHSDFMADWDKYKVYYSELKKFFQYNAGSNTGIYDPGDDRTQKKWRIARAKSDIFYAKLTKGNPVITVFSTKNYPLVQAGMAVTAQDGIKTGTTVKPTSPFKSKNEASEALDRFYVTLSEAPTRSLSYTPIILDIPMFSTNGLPASYDYYFDIIKPTSLAQYSIENIGRRTFSNESNTNITTLFPTIIHAPTYTDRKIIKFYDVQKDDLEIESFTTTANSASVSLKVSNASGYAPNDIVDLSSKISNTNALYTKLVSGGAKTVTSVPDQSTIVITAADTFSSSATYTNDNELTISAEATYRNIKATSIKYNKNNTVTFNFAAISGITSVFATNSFIFLDKTGVTNGDRSYKVISSTNKSVTISSNQKSFKLPYIYTCSIKTSAISTSIAPIIPGCALSGDGIQSGTIVKSFYNGIIELSKPISNTIKSSSKVYSSIISGVLSKQNQFNTINTTAKNIETKFSSEYNIASISNVDYLYTITVNSTGLPYVVGDYILLSGITPSDLNKENRIISISEVSGTTKISFYGTVKTAASLSAAKINKQNFLSILDSQVSSYISDSEFIYTNDAFSNLKDALYTHTNFNENISLSSIPMYNLDVNTRVTVTDSDTEISGEYYVNTIDIPFSPDSTMSVSATKIYDSNI